MSGPSSDAMRIALRVLTPVIDGKESNQQDIDALRRFTPLLADGPADELAREVIQQAMREHAIAL